MDIYKSRTKKILWSTLYTIITEQKISFDSITVNQICEEAEFHRTTFYKHFKDKYDLLKFGYSLLTAERKKFDVTKRLLEPFSLSEKLKQKQYYHLAFELSASTPYLRFFFQQMIDETIESDLLEFGHSNEVIPKNLLVSHVSSTLATLDNYWKNEAKNLQASEIDQLFKQMISPYFSTSA